MALRLAVDFKEMDQDEIMAMKQKRLETEPQFRYPMGG
jgi:hypothetical protein